MILSTSLFHKVVSCFTPQTNAYPLTNLGLQIFHLVLCQREVTARKILNRADKCLGLWASKQ